MMNRRVFLSATVAAGGVAAASPVLAQNGRYVPPHEGLLPPGHTVEAVSGPLDRQAMAAGRLVLVPSQNYTAYADWWTRRMRDARPNVFQRAVGHNEDTFRRVIDSLDPRTFSDRLIEILAPYFGEIAMATDIVAAREQGADFYGVVDYWLRPEGFWTQSYRTRAGLDVFDDRLRLLFAEAYNDLVPLQDFSVTSGGQGGSDAAAQTFANAMNAAFAHLSPRIAARLNAGA